MVESDQANKHGTEHDRIGGYLGASNCGSDYKMKNDQKAVDHHDNEVYDVENENEDDDPSSFYAKAYETYNEKQNHNMTSSINVNSIGGNRSHSSDNYDSEQDMYTFNYSDDDNLHTITFDHNHDEHANTNMSRNKHTNVHTHHTKNHINEYNENDEDSDALLVVNTVALNYDMGITNETKVCCSLCRRSQLFRAISKQSKRLYCCKETSNHNSNSNNDDDDDGGLQDKPSNEELLSMAFLTFLTFLICQLIAAVFAKSEAMLGDSAAMAVDAFTYGFNLVAEQLKNKLNLEQLQQRQQQQDQLSSSSHEQFIRLQEREMKKYKLYLELIPPVISVTALIGVTSIILKQSIQVLILDSTRDILEQTDPNIIVMGVFSFVNLFVDILNICFFASANHAFGYNTTEPYDITNKDEKDTHYHLSDGSDDDDTEIDWNNYDNGGDDQNYEEETVELVQQQPQDQDTNNTEPSAIQQMNGRKSEEYVITSSSYQSHIVDEKNVNMVRSSQS